MADTTTTPPIERRYVQNLELRADGDEPPKITGYAAVFNALSVPLGGFRESIRKGAFKRTLKAKADVRALVNHDPNLIIGRSLAGTLTLKEDDHGLLVEIDPPDTTAGRDVVESIRRGDIDGMSFGFQTVKDSWEYSADGTDDRRELLDVELFDVSPVTFPAYPDTDVAVRSQDVQAALASREAARPTPEPMDWKHNIDLARRKLRLAEAEAESV